MIKMYRKKRILLLPQTGPLGAASRYRIYQYVPFLEKAGYAVKIWPAAGDLIYRFRTHRPGMLSKAAWVIARSARRKMVSLFVRNYDVVLLQRETVPFGFPIIDLMLCMLAKKVIFDFDDAIYATAQHRPAWLTWLSDPHRIERILQRCDLAIVANDQLAEYAQRHAAKVVVIPTALPFAQYRRAKPEKARSEKTVIGWIGSPFTAFYLKNLFPVFSELAKKHRIEVRVIGARFEEKTDFPMRCLPWRPERELAGIQTFDIGVMPLSDDVWSRGKSGLKLLQYQAAGIAAVASPVGVNCELIRHEQNGLLAETPEEWRHALQRLIEDEAFRHNIAEAGQRMLDRRYDLDFAAQQLIQAIESL